MADSTTIRSAITLAAHIISWFALVTAIFAHNQPVIGWPAMFVLVTEVIIFATQERSPANDNP